MSFFIIKQFSLSHIALVLLAVIASVGIYFLLRNKSIKTKNIVAFVFSMLTVFSMAGVILYTAFFTTNPSIFELLPVQLSHICTILLIIATLSKSNKLKSITFLLTSFTATYGLVVLEQSIVGTTMLSITGALYFIPYVLLLITACILCSNTKVTVGDVFSSFSTLVVFTAFAHALNINLAYRFNIATVPNFFFTLQPRDFLMEFLHTSFIPKDFVYLLPLAVLYIALSFITFALAFATRSKTPTEQKIKEPAIKKEKKETKQTTTNDDNPETNERTDVTSYFINYDGEASLDKYREFVLSKSKELDEKVQENTEQAPVKTKKDKKKAKREKVKNKKSRASKEDKITNDKPKTNEPSDDDTHNSLSDFLKDTISIKPTKETTPYKKASGEEKLLPYQLDLQSKTDKPSESNIFKLSESTQLETIFNEDNSDTTFSGLNKKLDEKPNETNTTHKEVASDTNLLKTKDAVLDLKETPKKETTAPADIKTLETPTRNETAEKEKTPNPQTKLTEPKEEPAKEPTKKQDTPTDATNTTKTTSSITDKDSTPKDKKDSTPTTPAPSTITPATSHSVQETVIEPIALDQANDVNVSAKEKPLTHTLNEAKPSTKTNDDKESDLQSPLDDYDFMKELQEFRNMLNESDEKYKKATQDANLAKLNESLSQKKEPEKQSPNTNLDLLKSLRNKINKQD